MRAKNRERLEELERQVSLQKLLIDDLRMKMEKVEAQTTFQVVNGSLHWEDPESTPFRSYCHRFPEVKVGEVLKMILAQIKLKFNVQQKQTIVELVPDEEPSSKDK